MIVTIAVDSVDSPRAGCTTHFASLLLRRLAGRVKLADLPLLVRLNPGIPWKTRGNASIALRLYYDGSVGELAEEVSELAEAYSGGGGYGVVVATGAVWRDPDLRSLYLRALTSVVPRDVAIDVLEEKGVFWAGGRGVVGAASALAALAEGDDYTFELVAYRRPENWGSERCVIEGGRAALLEGELPSCVFNNYDYLTGELTAAPRGYDPVLAGFRGDCYESLPAYSRLLCEEPDFWTLFRSNQHTDAHARPLDGRLYPYESGYIRGVVVEDPEVLPGSHAVVEVETSDGVVDAVFYRESYPLNKIASMLSRGDTIVVYGSVRPYKPRGRVVVACEKLVVEKALEKKTVMNPRCPRCGSRMESSGHGKKLRCPSCGLKGLEKTEVRAPPRLTPGVYTPRPGRLRHLTAPPWRKPKRGFTPPLRPASVELALGTKPEILGDISLAV